MSRCAACIPSCATTPHTPLCEHPTPQLQTTATSKQPNMCLTHSTGKRARPGRQIRMDPQRSAARWRLLHRRCCQVRRRERHRLPCTQLGWGLLPGPKNGRYRICSHSRGWVHCRPWCRRLLRSRRSRVQHDDVCHRFRLLQLLCTVKQCWFRLCVPECRLRHEQLTHIRLHVDHRRRCSFCNERETKVALSSHPAAQAVHSSSCALFLFERAVGAGLTMCGSCTALRALGGPLSRVKATPFLNVPM